MSKWYKKVFYGSHCENIGHFPEKTSDLWVSSLRLRYGNVADQKMFTVAATIFSNS
jgi:hypothetical protein